MKNLEKAERYYQIPRLRTRDATSMRDHRVKKLISAASSQNQTSRKKGTYQENKGDRQKRKTAKRRKWLPEQIHSCREKQKTSPPNSEGVKPTRDLDTERGREKREKEGVARGSADTKFIQRN